MKSKLFSSFTLMNAYNKGFRQGSKLYKAGFIFVAIIKVLKFLFAKPKPETFKQFDLEPGEYKVVVREEKK